MLIPVITAILGILAGIFLERFKNRTVLLTYKKNLFQLATSAQHNHWGNIQIIYNNRETQHLSLITVEIKNDSNIDLENVRVDFWVDEQSRMLAHQANYVETGNSIFLEGTYLEELNEVIILNNTDLEIKITNPDHVTPSELSKRILTVLANKVFVLSVFNRNTSVKFQILVENLVGAIPSLSLSTLHKSCKLVRQEDEVVITKKRNKYVGWLWLLLSASTIIILHYRFRNLNNVIIWTGILTIVMLYVALALYHLFALLRKLFR